MVDTNSGLTIDIGKFQHSYLTLQNANSSLRPTNSSLCSNELFAMAQARRCELGVAHAFRPTRGIGIIAVKPANCRRLPMTY